jgi:urea transport system substrate-binding protein
MEHSGVAGRIRASKAAVVFSTINGIGNVAFYRQYRNAGITADDIPIMAVSAAEDEVRAINGTAAQGHYAAWNYFQSLNTPENKLFVDKLRSRYWGDRVTDDPIETAYFQVHLWAQAVRKAGSIEVDAVRRAALGQEFESPGGRVRIDPKNLHTWKTVRIQKFYPMASSGLFTTRRVRCVRSPGTICCSRIANGLDQGRHSRQKELSYRPASVVYGRAILA